MENYIHVKMIHNEMEQYYLKQGIQELKKYGEYTIKKELNQTHMNNTFDYQDE